MIDDIRNFDLEVLPERHSRWAAGAAGSHREWIPGRPLLRANSSIGGGVRVGITGSRTPPLFCFGGTTCAQKPIAYAALSALLKVVVPPDLGFRCATPQATLCHAFGIPVAPQYVLTLPVHSRYNPPSLPKISPGRFVFMKFLLLSSPRRIAARTARLCAARAASMLSARATRS